MSELAIHIDRQMQHVLQVGGGNPYYRKASRRYRDTFALAYPFLAEGGKSVLDIGGWQMGLLAAPMASRVTAVTLGGPSRELVDRYGFELQSFDIMADEFPLEGAQFDVVFFLEILEHLPPPTDRVMQRLRGLVRPGGRLVLSVPNLAFWQKRLKFFFLGRSPLKLGDERDDDGGYHHIRTYTGRECRTLLERHGFRVLESRAGNYQHGWANVPLRYVERAIPSIAHKLMFVATPAG